VPWRFLDAGQLSVRSLLVAGVQKPAHERTHAPQQMAYQFDQIDGNDAWLTRVVRMMFLAPFYVMFVNIAMEGLKHAFPDNAQYAPASSMES
jgi:hypothetical protein